METIICRVVSQTEPGFVNTKDGKQVAKCYLRVKALGGDYANKYVCAVLGNLAQVRFQQGEVVAVVLRFRIFESHGNLYQDVTATDIVKLKN